MVRLLAKLKRRSLYAFAIMSSTYLNRWTMDDVDLISMDVFETLVIRPCAYPHHLHEITGHRLQSLLPPNLTPEQWRAERVTAEAAARKNQHGKEVTLVDIYIILRDKFHRDDAWIRDAMAIECETELNALTPIASSCNYVNSARKARKHIAFLSDMYLPETTIRKALQNANVFAETDSLFVSSTHGACKSTGKLFHALLSHSPFPPSRMAHTGDNAWSDLTMPHIKGLKTRLSKEHAFNRYEKAIMARHDAPEMIRSIMAGVSRSVRLSRHFDSLHDRTVWDTAASVAAPLLIGFVLWTLLEARKHGHETLYFLARDGQILLRIAQCIAPYFGITISGIYLYASRQALFLPTLDSNKADFETLFAHTITDKTVREIAYLLSLPDAAFMDVATSADIDVSNPQLKISQTQAKQLINALRKSPLSDELSKNNTVQHEGMRQYFKRIGLLDQKNAAIVDVGWQGNLQLYMARLLHDINPDQRLEGFYLGLFKQPPPESGATHRYFKDITGLYVGTIEVFCSADHASLQAYWPESHTQEALRFTAPDNKQALEWGLLLQQESIMAYTRQFAEHARYYAPETIIKALRTLSIANYESFCKTPSVNEANTYGSFMHASDPAHSVFDPIAPRLSLAELFRKYVCKHHHIKLSYWPHATIIRSIEQSPLNKGSAIALKLLRRISRKKPYLHHP